MKIAVATSTHPNPEQAASESYAALLEKLGGTPHLLLVHSSCDYDNEALINRLRALQVPMPPSIMLAFGSIDRE